jgi:hypothetical protein
LPAILLPAIPDREESYQVTTVDKPTLAAARAARDEADQRMAMAFDAKSRAADHLSRLRLTNASADEISAAEADHARAVEIFRTAQLAADEADRTERDTRKSR